MAPLRVMIVDDEQIARKVLREELELCTALQVVAEASDGCSALEKIRELGPDVVFLDIQMPGLDGFSLLDQLNSTPLPAIIMVTAFNQHAIRAFEAGAIDYLLKPVSPERVRQAVERAARLCRQPQAVAEDIARLQQVAQAGAQKEARVQKIVGKLGDEFYLLNSEEVLAFQANGELVWIVTAKQRYLATQNLKALETRLPETSFLRIHRNALVNLNHIRKMSMLTSQRWLCTLNNGQEFIVSKRQAHRVRAVLHW